MDGVPAGKGPTRSGTGSAGPTRSGTGSAGPTRSGLGGAADPLLAAVQAATLAPSMHNTQPWRFRLADGCLEIWADPARGLPVADPDGWATRIACGAAAQNAVVALAAAEVTVRVELCPEPGSPLLLARVVPTGTRLATEEEWALSRAIPRRHSNRHPFADTPVPGQSRAALVAAAGRYDRAWLDLSAGRESLERIAALVREADDRLRADPAYAAELAGYSRGAAPTGLGIPRYAAGLAARPGDLLAMRDFGGLERGGLVQFEADPLVGILGTITDSARDQVLAGLALQRVLLTATLHGLAVTILSQPVEVPATRLALRRLVRHIGPPQLLLRIGYGEPAFATPRRPLREVLS